MDDEELARLRAEADQAREGLKEFAGMIRGFYDGLVDEGFTEAQALRLTAAFVRTTANSGGES